jgi:hypothetical protein
MNQRTLIVRLSAAWIAAVMIAMTGGCSLGQGSCAAPRAEMPSTAAAGTTVTVKMFELWASCADQGQGASAPMTKVEVRGVSTKDPNKVLTTAVADVGKDASAVVTLSLPTDASGTLTVQVGDQTVGQLTISAG